MDRKCVIPPALSQHGGREQRLVGRIGEMLRFQAKSGVLPIDFAVLSSERPVKKVSRVQLNSRLSGPDFH